MDALDTLFAHFKPAARMSFHGAVRHASPMDMTMVICTCCGLAALRSSCTLRGPCIRPSLAPSWCRAPSHTVDRRRGQRRHTGMRQSRSARIAGAPLALALPAGL